MATIQTFDITSFVSGLRQQANILADYNGYRTLCSRRLSTLRKRLGKSKGQRKNEPYKQIVVTAEDLGNEPTHVHLYLYASERAWAHAMEMKSLSSEDPQSISRSVKDHIKSRLQKAYLHAFQLQELLSRPESKGTDMDILEVTAYASSLGGGVAFEKQHWERALKNFSIARIAYEVLCNAVKADMYKEFLSSTVDPSIRYTAYQMGIPRSTEVAEIAKNFFPKDDETLLATLKRVDPKAGGLGVDEIEVDDVPVVVINSVSWRGRTATVDEADIAVALGGAQKAEETLKAYIDENPEKDHAAAFDELLQASQDTVDTTKRAIDRAIADGVSTADPKFQKLQLIFTYVNYDLISRRIGRDRKMVETISKPDKRSAKQGSAAKELVVLYDAILQSLDQISELPGVAADEALGFELEAKRNFFSALRCSVIATSHTSRRNALALYYKALIYITRAIPAIPPTVDSTIVRGLDIQRSEVEAQGKLLQNEVARFRALAEMERLGLAEQSQQLSCVPPLIDNLNAYHEKVDFSNLVPYPPRLEPIPTKPIFFDIASNYIKYPGMEEPSKDKQTTAKPQETARKGGLFGFFGR